MSLIVLASDKGSPGVTTTAVALAGVWPRRAILAECDPSGGDLVYRAPADNGSPLNPNIGMLSLATAARHGLSPNQLEQHLQRMHGGLELVTGLATGDQSAGLAGLWPILGRAFAGLPDADVIADCGRAGPASQAMDLMAAASLVVLVARTSAEQIAHVRDRALSLMHRAAGPSGTGLGMPIGVVLIVDPKQRARVTAQVDELLRNSGLPVKVIGTIADDPDGADLINGRGRGRLDRTLLIRSTREVALDLYRRFTMPSQGVGSGVASQGVGSGPGAGPGMALQGPGSGMPPQGPGPGMPSQGPGSGPGMPPQGPGSGMPPQAPGMPGGAPMPPQQQYSAPPIPQPGPMAPPPGPQPGPPIPPPHAPQGMPAGQTAPANGYLPPPPAPGTPKQPMFQRDAPTQPTVWPGDQPPPPPPSAHEGFTSVTLGGDPGPRHGPPPRQYSGEHRDSNSDDFYEIPPRGELGPGQGGQHSGPQ